MTFCFCVRIGLSAPRQFPKLIPEERALPPFRKVKPQRPERGGPMSPKHPPRRQETARLAKNRCSGERRERRFWSSKMSPKLLLGNSGTRLDQPSAIPEISTFGQILNFTNFVHAQFADSSRVCGAKRLQID